jgi:formylmethanofuran dehydrogenase subunit E
VIAGIVKKCQYETFRFVCKKCGTIVTIEYDSTVDKRPLCAECKKKEEYK